MRTNIGYATYAKCFLYWDIDQRMNMARIDSVCLFLVEQLASLPPWRFCTVMWCPLAFKQRLFFSCIFFQKVSSSSLQIPFATNSWTWRKLLYAVWNWLVGKVLKKDNSAVVSKRDLSYISCFLHMQHFACLLFVFQFSNQAEMKEIPPLHIWIYIRSESQVSHLQLDFTHCSLNCLQPQLLAWTFFLPIWNKPIRAAGSFPNCVALSRTSAFPTLSRFSRIPRDKIMQHWTLFWINANCCKLICFLLLDKCSFA